MISMQEWELENLISDLKWRIQRAENERYNANAQLKTLYMELARTEAIEATPNEEGVFTDRHSRS